MSTYVKKTTTGDTSWFIRDRFGMFIHFGTYSLAARHEWVKNYEMIHDEKYNDYFEFFDPDLFDAKEWAKQAKNAGMKYAVLTAKHHEGFCLFDSKYTDYKSTNTPFGRDIVKEYVEAFREAGLRVGLYYSLLDWHHPDYTVDWYHPLRRDPRGAALNDGKDFSRYVTYLHNQVEELMTNYGKIDILWFDFSYPDPIPGLPPTHDVYPLDWMVGRGKNDWKSEELIAMIRKYQPGIIINNRLDIDQDVWTPEQNTPKEWVKHPETGELVTWEACQTFSGSWGYNRDEMSWKKPKALLEMLINMVSCGGNLIMNVGPTGRGNFDYRAEAALKVFGDWMKLCGRSVYNCTMAEPEFTAPRGCRLTQSQDGKRLYIHLLEYPQAYLEVPELYGKVAYAQFLHDASEIAFTEQRILHAGDVIGDAGDTFLIKIPAIQPEIMIPVIEIFLK